MKLPPHFPKVRLWNNCAFKSQLRSLCQPESKALRGKLWNKMGFICSARRARGVMETLDPAAATLTA